MAFLHLLNCLLLTYAPIFLIYNTTSIHEAGAQLCLGGLVGYLLSSMMKLLACAILVPESESFNVVFETIKESVSLVDVYMIAWIFTWKFTRTTDKKTRVLGVGLGWAAAELICSHLLIFVINAGGGEFSWEYLQRAINANFSLIQGIALVNFASAYSSSKGFLRMASLGLILAQIVLRPVAINALVNQGVLNSWTGLVAQGVWTVGIFFTGKLIVD